MSEDHRHGRWVWIELECNARKRKKRKRRARWTVRFDGITLCLKGNFAMDVKDTAGPFALDVSLFVDAKDNPTTDADIPVYSVDNADVATVVANDPAGTDPQGAVLTLTGKLGQVNVSATFGDPTSGGFVVTSNGAINVLPGAAVSATMTITDTAAA